MLVELFFLFLFSPYQADILVPVDRAAYSSQETTYTHNMLELLDDFDKDPDTPEDKWFAMDKFWHWAMAFALTGSSYQLVHNQIDMPDPEATAISLSSTLFFSILKEFYDLYTYNLFSLKDLCYDVLGMATGYMVFIWDWNV
jgi:uncharacterized protein YfiM (DUF2279 family)